MTIEYYTMDLDGVRAVTPKYIINVIHCLVGRESILIEILNEKDDIRLERKNVCQLNVIDTGGFHDCSFDERC